MKKIIIVLSVLILLFVAAVYLFSDKPATVSNEPLPQTQKVSYKNITSKELNTMLSAKDFYFVNVHTPYYGEIEKTDAFIPYNEIENNLSKLPSDKNAQIVLYCRSGMMSKTAAEKLTALGYTNIYNLTAGMIDWEKQGYTLIKKPQ